jgi:hypothetical protein
MAISGYSINGYYAYFIMAIILMVICGYYINGYWWPLLVVLNYITTIGDFSIINYCWIS